ncbi:MULTISPECIES: beta/gamma crystallin domain-containing protein [Streptomyces]|nr:MULTISPECIES: beta/gamma crystallin domain-containing protein [Streptomyces]
MNRSLKRVLVTAAATGALTAALPLSTAMAINQTGCGNRTDLVKITYNNGSSSVCFANAGAVNVNYSGVIRVTSGNNRLRFVSNGETYSMEKWASKRIIDGTPHTITRLRIL